MNYHEQQVFEVMRQREDEVLRLFHFEPPPIEPGGCAGTRNEGVQFRDAMASWLERDGVEVVTVLGKSTDGLRVDGNAQERVSYKMLRFKRDPMNRDCVLVVAFNRVFARLGSPLLAELRTQAAYLNGLSPFAPIVFLATEDEYRRFVATYPNEREVAHA